MVWETAQIWKDEEGKFWTLADSSIDLEIFEIIGEPVLDERTRRWFQEIAFRFSDPAR
jgi:hypothetical protein